MSNKKRAPGRPSKYPPEFQRDAVAMVLDDGRSIADVARSIGVIEGTLGNWVGKARRERQQGSSLTGDERAELAGLRRWLDGVEVACAARLEVSIPPLGGHLV